MPDAVLLALAEDLGDDRRSFVNAVIRTIDELSSGTSAAAKKKDPDSPHQDTTSFISSGGSSKQGASHESTMPSSPSAINHKKNPPSSACSPLRMTSGPPSEIHFIVAGSKRHASHLDPNNIHIHRSTWDRAWTSGEQVFTEIINGVGIDRFGPRTNMSAYLVDVGSRTTLAEIAREVERVLQRKRVSDVGRVYLMISSVMASMNIENENRNDAEVCPGDSHHGLMEEVQRNFTTVWSKDECVLSGVSLDFVNAYQTRGFSRQQRFGTVAGRNYVWCSSKS